MILVLHFQTYPYKRMMMKWCYCIFEYTVEIRTDGLFNQIWFTVIVTCVTSKKDLQYSNIR